MYVYWSTATIRILCTKIVCNVNVVAYIVRHNYVLLYMVHKVQLF